MLKVGGQLGVGALPRLTPSPHPTAAWTARGPRDSSAGCGSPACSCTDMRPPQGPLDSIYGPGPSKPGRLDSCHLRVDSLAAPETCAPSPRSQLASFCKKGITLFCRGLGPSHFICLEYYREVNLSPLASLQGDRLRGCDCPQVSSHLPFAHSSHGYFLPPALCPDPAGHWGFHANHGYGKPAPWGVQCQWGGMPTPVPQNPNAFPWP